MSVAEGSIEGQYSALLQWCQFQQQAQDASDWVFQFDVDGIHFFCFYDALTRPEHVCIRCDVFELAGEREASLLRLLLKDNCIRHQQGMPVFSLNVEQGRVVALWNVSLLTCTARAFALQLHRWVRDVKQWQHVSMSEVDSTRGGRRAQ